MGEKGKIVSIVGPTATGKTNKALEIAAEILRFKQFAGVDLISVDSRQVYRGLEILTGADVPEGFVLRQAQDDTFRLALGDSMFFANVDGSIRLFGVSIIDPSEEWSVAHFKNMAQKIIAAAQEENRQVILVGGTGLYHRYLFGDLPSLAVPPNLKLRQELEDFRVDQLRAKLADLDPAKFVSLNPSDRANKRRLIRAIELVAGGQGDKAGVVLSEIEIDTVLLTAPLAEIETKIKHRVAKRFASGAVSEVKNLLTLGLPASAPVLSTLGVPEISQFLQKQLTATECQALWALHEYQYAKRQLTWWKMVE